MNDHELRTCINELDWPYLRQKYSRADIDMLRGQMDDLGLDEADQARVLVDSGLVTAPHCGIDNCPACMTVDGVACLPGYDYNLQVEHGLVLTGNQNPKIAAELVNKLFELDWLQGQGIVNARPFGICTVIIDLV